MNDAPVFQFFSSNGDPLAADPHLDRRQPLLPLFGGLWLVIGVQEKVPAFRAAAVLPSEQEHTE